jgi:23S rRNA (cytidine1920-2'-O)/16S rRNA (cytidine1409-2'-O)-methyltransferase
LYEKTDIFEVRKKTIPTPDVILADVSFISLTKILKYAKDNLVVEETDFLVMLKPQFEADDRDLKDGVIKNDSLRRQVIKKFEQWLKLNGFLIIKKKDNDLKGKHGNIERFYYLRLAK